MRRSVGKSHERLLRENLVFEIRHFAVMFHSGAKDEELVEQRGVIRGCAMQLASWCSYLHHRNPHAVYDVMRTVVREVLMDLGQASPQTAAQEDVVSSAF